MLIGASMTAPWAMRTTAASSKNAVFSAVKADDSARGELWSSHARTSGDVQRVGQPGHGSAPAGTAATDDSASWNRPLTNTSSAAVADAIQVPGQVGACDGRVLGRAVERRRGDGRDVGEAVLLVGRRRKAQRGEPAQSPPARACSSAAGPAGRRSFSASNAATYRSTCGAGRALFGQLAHTAAPCSSQP